MTYRHDPCQVCGRSGCYCIENMIKIQFERYNIPFENDEGPHCSLKNKIVDDYLQNAIDKQNQNSV